MQEAVNEFYVYIYLDPRKPGEYKYDDYKFDYEPFYVGKGKGSRLYQHLFKQDVRNINKTNKIKNILSENLEPIILKVKENLNEIESFEFEEKLISLIGRTIDDSGSLTNIILGGKIRPLSGENNSFFGHKRSSWHKEQMLIGFIKHVEKLKNDENYKNKIVQKSIETKIKKFGKMPANFLGRKHSIKTKNKISQANSINQKGNKNSQYGTCWIHNLDLKENKKIKKEELSKWLDEDWIEGRKMKF